MSRVFIFVSCQGLTPHAQGLTPHVVSTEKKMTQEILEKVIALIATSGEEYSVDIRLYLMATGAAEYTRHHSVLT